MLFKDTIHLKRGITDESDLLKGKITKVSMILPLETRFVCQFMATPVLIVEIFQSVLMW